MEAFTKLVAYFYRSDPTTAGLTISFIEDRQNRGNYLFYMSVTRFTEPFGGGKQVIAKAMHKNFNLCLDLLKADWASKIEGTQGWLILLKRVTPLPVAKIRQPEASVAPKGYNTEELAASMKQIGQQLPIIVFPVEDTEGVDYEVYNGMRRLDAAKSIGMEELQCQIILPPSFIEPSL